MSDNPYRPPEALSGSRSSTSLDVRVQGKQLVVRTGAVLPAFCVKTNEVVRPEEMQNRSFTWCSPLVGLLILLSGPLLILVYFLLRKHCRLTFGLSPEIRRKYRNRKLLKTLAIVVLFFSIPIAAGAESAAIVIGVVVAFLVAVVSLFVGNSPLTVRAHRDGEFWIEGCSHEFLSRLAE